MGIQQVFPVLEYRNATDKDLPGIVEIHLQAFPNFFLSRLGARFLRRFYSCFLFEASGILLVADSGRLAGFAAGTSSPEDFYRNIRRKHAFALGLAAAPALIGMPRLILQKLAQAFRPAGGKLAPIDGAALLSSIAVTHSAQGGPAGSELLNAFERAVELSGCKQIYLTTDAVANERVLAFYKKNGFQIESSYIQGRHRPMHRLHKYLGNNHG